MIFNRLKQSPKAPGRRNRQTPPLRTSRNRSAATPPAGQNRTFSYYSSRSQSELKTGREAVQNKPPIRRLPTRLQRLRRHSGWFAASLVLAVLGVYELQLSTMPKVVSVAATSDAPFLQDGQTYQQAAHELFNASASNRNKLTVNASGIAAKLQKQFPELQQVSISLPIIGSTPTVYVRPAEPALVLAAANGTYIVDENGRALAEATAGTNLSRLNIPSVTDQSSLQVRLGQQVLPRTATGFVSTVAEQLRAQKIDVQSMTLPALAGELDVYLTGKSYFVKFNLQQGGAEIAAKQAGTFIAVNKQLEKQNITPSQYVDVRLEGRAYYK
jgi:cell division septal protein FtsQ